MRLHLQTAVQCLKWFTKKTKSDADVADGDNDEDVDKDGDVLMMMTDDGHEDENHADDS